MKRDELRKLKDKTVPELQKDLTAAREELRVLKFDLTAGKAKNIRTITETKKRIARIMTFLQQAQDGERSRTIIAEKSKTNNNG